MIVNLCPRCHTPVDVSPGKAIDVNRRVDTGQVNVHGDRMEFVPTVDAMIAECTNLECPGFSAAGTVDGVGFFLENRELVTVNTVRRMWMRYRDERGHHDPTTL